MRNKILSITRNSIPYVKELNNISGGIVSSILMQQLDYWFEKYPDGFFKFLEPAEKSKYYKKGCSWIEEIGISKDEFRTAFDKIGIRHKSKTAFEAASDKFKAIENSGKTVQKMYCSYTNKIEGVTYYFRNHLLLDAKLDEISEKKYVSSRKLDMPIYGDKESQHTEIRNANTDYIEDTKEEEESPLSQNLKNLSNTSAKNPLPENKSSAEILQKQEIKEQKQLNSVEIFIQATEIRDCYIKETDHKRNVPCVEEIVTAILQRPTYAKYIYKIKDALKIYINDKKRTAKEHEDFTVYLLSLENYLSKGYYESQIDLMSKTTNQPPKPFMPLTQKYDLR